MKTSKNIHILPTDKPRFDKYLVLNKKGKLCIWNTNTMGSQKTLPNQNIYITSDEEIKSGYYLDLTHNIVMQSVFYPSSDKNCKKIILTTDQDLIKDGVQAIPDEFLEWFVTKANDSGKPIDIIKVEKLFGDRTPFEPLYKIIIPKEEPEQEIIASKEDAEIFLNAITNIPEPNEKLKKAFREYGKQETLEEAVKRYSANELSKLGFINGANWQAERMYSEEDVINILVEFSAEIKNVWNITEWFEQFKKK